MSPLIPPLFPLARHSQPLSTISVSMKSVVITEPHEELNNYANVRIVHGRSRSNNLDQMGELSRYFADWTLLKCSL